MAHQHLEETQRNRSNGRYAVILPTFRDSTQGSSTALCQNPGQVLWPFPRMMEVEPWPSVFQSSLLSLVERILAFPGMIWVRVKVLWLQLCDKTDQELLALICQHKPGLIMLSTRLQLVPLEFCQKPVFLQDAILQRNQCCSLTLTFIFKGLIRFLVEQICQV